MSCSRKVGSAHKKQKNMFQEYLHQSKWKVYEARSCPLYRIMKFMWAPLQKLALWKSKFDLDMYNEKM